MSRRPTFVLLMLLACGSVFSQAEQKSKYPYPEKLTYRVEWRLITAGTAIVRLSPANPDGWQSTLNLESAGLVTRLYRVLDTYKAVSDQKFCAVSSVLDAQESKRHTVTRLTFANTRHKVEYDERDLLKNTTVKRELDIAPCTYEVAGALAALRATSLEPGKSVSFPITDGKKLAYGKIEAQGKESVNAGGKTYQTTRYEAFLFDNVLYRRKGRLFVWMTDDSDHLPVQFRVQLGFPIGTITLELEKQEKL